MTEWQEPPPALYKFTGVTEDCIRLLSKNELQYQAPCKFNDPFDCRVRTTFEGSKSQRLLRLAEVFQDVYPLISWRVARAQAEDLLRRWSPELERRLEDDSIRDAQDNLAVSCFTARHDHLLMWAHYARGHTGVCLRFDAAMPPFRRAFRVEYADDYPRVSHFHDKAIEDHFRPVLRKSINWSYEEEWRLVSYRHSTGGHGPGWIPFPPQALTGVILGCKISELDRARVVDALQARPDPVEIVRATVHRERYALEFEQHEAVSMR